MTITDRLRSRRAASRERRAIARAIAAAPTPSMRNELLTIAQRQAAHLR